MFEATLSRRDPEAVLRWLGAIAVVGTTGVVTALALFSAVVVKWLLYMLAWVLFSFFAGPQPVWQDEYLMIVEVDILEEWEPLEELEPAFLEPDQLIGEAPAPPRLNPVQPEAAHIERLALLGALSDGGESMALLGVLGSLESSGSMSDVFSSAGGFGGDLDGALGGLVGSDMGVGVGSGGLGSRGSGGGGTSANMIGVGGLGSRGSGQGEVAGLGKNGGYKLNTARVRTDEIPAGESARCSVAVNPSASTPAERMVVRGCAMGLRSLATSAVRRQGYDGVRGTVIVRLKGTGEDPGATE